MGKELYCDLCRKSVAIEEALKKVAIGENIIAEVCLTCGSQLEQSLKKQMADNEAAMIMARKAAQAPPKQPEAPKETGPSVLSDEEIKKKITGAD